MVSMRSPMASGPMMASPKDFVASLAMGKAFMTDESLANGLVFSLHFFNRRLPPRLAVFSPLFSRNDRSFRRATTDHFSLCATIDFRPPSSTSSSSSISISSPIRRPSVVGGGLPRPPRGSPNPRFPPPLRGPGKSPSSPSSPPPLFPTSPIGPPLAPVRAVIADGNPVVPIVRCYLVSENLFPVAVPLKASPVVALWVSWDDFVLLLPLLITISLIGKIFHNSKIWQPRMNYQQLAHPKSSPNGIGRRKSEREGGMKLDNRLHSGKSGISKTGSIGSMPDSKVGGNLSPFHDRLVYSLTRLIGHHVEVQVKNGSIYSGIYHAANVNKDIGIILKMARMIKDGSVQLQRANTESLNKAFAKTFVIPAKELVQVIAKDFSLAGDGLSNELQLEKRQEILIDSCISQARHVDSERELKPWIPDEDDPQRPELENVFDIPSDRGWDQFEVNETLFGVKSTYDEDLYTTKLERGPQMRELERVAGRIAREIEGEETQDLHLAEERGVRFHDSFNIDEETRFSSVYRGGVIDDSGYVEEEDILLDSWNTETFGSAPASIMIGSLDGTDTDATQASARSSSTDGPETSHSSVGVDLSQIGADDAGRLSSELTCKSVLASGDDNRVQERSLSEQSGHTELDDAGKLPPAKDTRISKAEGKSGSSHKGGVLAKAAAPASSTVALTDHNKMNSRGDLSETPTLAKSGETQSVDSHGRPGSSTSSASDRLGAASAPTGARLTPSSSVGSLSSEKSNLNPHAKEFKLNPNAKSFVPSQTPVRPVSPAGDGSFYYPANMPGVPQMPNMPVGVGMGGPFVGHQPLIFNAQVPPGQSPQAYLHPNGPHYGQHMLVAHPRQLPYMPGFPPDMPYKGRDF